ncbi:hypothetical protein INT47_011637 [Mucor saturninus]|uniref:Uncharacterized protein n=1 Tax=Mucor saturninus TaxID=64648 RepID=A0A8H7R481_9FUNG|nr:hypothetical protein INT47_011637 [Mucor saturninus]
MLTRVLKRTFTTQETRTVDAQCLPLKPTWSIGSLMEPVDNGISQDQFERLLSLSRLKCKDRDQANGFKKDIDQLSQFTKHLQLHDFKEEPLTHIWQQEKGQLVREDKETHVDGRELLKYAKKKSGNFYVVKGTMPSS